MKYWFELTHFKTIVNALRALFMTTPFETTFSVVTRRLTTKYEAIFRNALSFTRMQKRPCLWPHLIRPYSNPPRHSASVPLSLAAVVLWSRISTQHLETQATWRRRRVIVFGLARSISRYFVIFRDISRYFAKSNNFPRETTLGEGNTSKRQPTFWCFRYIRKRCGHKQGREHGSYIILKIFKRWCQKVWS